MDGSFKRNPVFLRAIERAKKSGASLRLPSYLAYKFSRGCIDYPLNICEMTKEQGLDRGKNCDKAKRAYDAAVEGAGTRYE